MVNVLVYSRADIHMSGDVTPRKQKQPLAGQRGGVRGASGWHDASTCQNRDLRVGRWENRCC